MAILLDEKTRVLVQGITGREGAARARFMAAYGTQVVAGVTPGKGGTTVGAIPVYNTVREAIERHGMMDATVTFVPGPVVRQAVVEAVEAGIRLVVMPVERVPVHDALRMLAAARAAGARVLGPGSLGIISAGRAVAGWIGGSEDFARELLRPGPVGLISRSGGQTSTFCWAISQAGLGISTALHVGSEPVVGLTPAELLPMFEADPETRAVALFGEIGTVAEEEAAEVLAAGKFTKPLVAYIAGSGVRPGMRFSHASAIVEGGRGTAEGKIKALRAAGATVVDRPEDLAPALVRLLGSAGPANGRDIAGGRPFSGGGGTISIPAAVRQPGLISVPAPTPASEPGDEGRREDAGHPEENRLRASLPGGPPAARIRPPDAAHNRGSAAGPGRSPLLRSMLFVPGNNMRMIAKCGALGADAVILDLEDSVPVSDKETARLFVRDALAAVGAGGAAVFVRINAAETGLDVEDLDWVVRAGLDGIVMPKAESAEGVAALAGRLERLERERGLAAGSVRVVPILESARGVLAAAAVGAASPRVAALALGGVDFSRDMGVELTPDGWELFYARSHLAVAARACGVAAIDSPCLAARDGAQLAAEARRARGLGFRGKLLIHPAQVEAVNAAFSPAESEMAWARRVVAAFEAAEKAGQGAIALEGKMVDRANFRQAQDLLAAAEAAAARPSGAVRGGAGG